MLIARFVTNKNELAHTRSYEDFSKFLGSRPERLGIMARLNPDHTMSFITESLMNVWYNDKQPKKFQSINSLQYEWEVDVDFVKRIAFTKVPVALFGQDYEIAFAERFYEKNDTFRVDKSKQHMIVKHEPVLNYDGTYTYVCQLIDAEYASVLDLNSCQPGMTTLFMSNYQPEFHEIGYSKYQSNIEKHRNYISLHRNDISFSAQYAAMEDVFIGLGKGDGNGNIKETIFKMDKAERVVFNSFMDARNNGLVFGKSNFDKYGKCTVQDAETQRDIPMGDGLISQIERYAPRFMFSKLTVNVFEEAILYMNQKAAQSQGNHYLLIVNDRLMNLIQKTLREYLRGWNTTGTLMFSQAAGQEVEVGANFTSYSYMGNTITFKVDRSLTREYMDKAYGVFVDLTADKATGKPAVQMFSLKNAEFVTNKFKGVGGFSGTESGEVASPVAASKLINWGYASVGVFSPYRSFIIQES